MDEKLWKSINSSPTLVFEGKNKESNAMATLVTDIDKLSFKAKRTGHYLGDVPDDASAFAGYGVLPGDDGGGTGDESNDEDDEGGNGGLGTLNRLPMELQLRVVSSLDPCTAVSLRAAGAATRRLVDASLEFCLVRDFPGLLRAVRCLFDPFPGADCNCPYDLAGLAASAVRNERCVLCCKNGADNDNGEPSYGDCLYVLTGERLCYPCFREARGFVPQGITDEYWSELRSIAAAEAGVTAMPAAPMRPPIPCAIVPPGRYGMRGYSIVKSPQRVVGRRALRAFLRRPHRQLLPSPPRRRPMEIPDPDAEPNQDQEPADPEETARQQFLGSPQARRAESWDRAPLAARYTVVIPAPYLVGPDTGTIFPALLPPSSTSDLGPTPARFEFEEGLFCHACVRSAPPERSADWRPESTFWAHPFRRYTRAGFKRHLLACSENGIADGEQEEEGRAGVLWNPNPRPGEPKRAHPGPKTRCGYPPTFELMSITFFSWLGGRWPRDLKPGPREWTERRYGFSYAFKLEEELAAARERSDDGSGGGRAINGGQGIVGEATQLDVVHASVDNLE